MNSNIKPKTYIIYLLLAPSMIVFIICCIAPLFVAAYNSLFEWSGGPVKTFVGMQNYIELLQDKAFWNAFKNNMTFILWTLIGQIGTAFVIAMLLQSRILKFKTLHRTVIFFPVVLSAVVVGFLWRIMYNTEYGIVNLFLRGLGLDSWIQLWLDNPDIVVGSLAIPRIWQFIGYYLVILLATIQGIEPSVLEMAELDGATGIKKSVYIVLPLIKSTLIVTVMLCISGNMKTFDQIFVMTGGGPGNSSEVLALYAYNVSMNRMQYGYGSAAAMGIMILSLGLIAISKVLGGRKKTDD